MKIRLSEIPSEGRSYVYDREKGELDEALAELIGDHAYEAQLTIKPVDQAFDLRGSVRTTITEACSTCGYDFEMPIKKEFHEFIVEDTGDDRKSHSVHGNQSVDFLGEGPEMGTYKGDNFDPGAYFHELIALQKELYPTCGGNGACLHADEAKAIREKLAAEFAAADEVKSGHPAFSALKKLDINKKK